MFHKALKELRKKHKLSQRQLADEIKVAPSTISMYEQGKRSPNEELLKIIATYFHVSTDYLLGHVTKNENEDTELNGYLEKIRSDPDIRILLDKASKVNKEQLEAAITFLEIMERKQNGDNNV